MKPHDDIALLAGEWAGAKAVSGDWLLKGGAQGSLRESVWGATEEVVKAQLALMEHSTELFLHRINTAGHIGLSGIGDMILLGEDESATTLLHLLSVFLTTRGAFLPRPTVSFGAAAAAGPTIYAVYHDRPVAVKQFTVVANCTNTVSSR